MISGLLDELGQKLADRWLSLLVIPGVFYLAVATCARTLGQRHALNLDDLTSHVTAWTKNPLATTAGGQIVLLAAILAGAAGIGLLAQATGAAVERLALAADWRAWPGPLQAAADKLVARRRQAWNPAHTLYQDLYQQAADDRAAGRPRSDPAERHDAYRAWMRISLEEPDRPTWSGDRIHAVIIRIRRNLGADLAIIWPFLWQILPSDTRTDLITARQAITRATTLTAWSLLYLPLAWWWWPALPTAAIIAATARRRTRTAASTYASLIEAVVRTHITDLADRQGIASAGPPTPALGAALSHLLHTQPPAMPASKALARPTLRRRVSRRSADGRPRERE